MYQYRKILTDGVTSGLTYAIGQLIARSAKLSNTSSSDRIPANVSNNCKHDASINHKSCKKIEAFKETHLQNTSENVAEVSTTRATSPF